MKYIKTFENNSIYNMDYNGIIYIADSIDTNSIPSIQYWIYIKDNSEEYEESEKINSISGIKNDSFVIDDFLTNEYDIISPFSDTFYSTNVKELKKNSSYGMLIDDFYNVNFIDIFIKKLKSDFNKANYSFKIIDVKLVEVIDYNNVKIFSNNDVELYKNTKKYNL